LFLARKSLALGKGECFGFLKSVVSITALQSKRRTSQDVGEKPHGFKVLRRRVAIHGGDRFAVAP
jgi:hypothetical protein